MILIFLIAVFSCCLVAWLVRLLSMPLILYSLYVFVWCCVACPTIFWINVLICCALHLHMFHFILIFHVCRHVLLFPFCTLMAARCQCGDIRVCIDSANDMPRGHISQRSSIDMWSSLQSSLEAPSESCGGWKSPLQVRKKDFCRIYTVTNETLLKIKRFYSKLISIEVWMVSVTYWNISLRKMCPKHSQFGKLP